MDFSYSAKAQDYLARLQQFMRDEVYPAEAAYFQSLSHSPNHQHWRQPEVMEQLKVKAKAAGLWNLFLPDEEYGA
ncbi:MAG: acyl-CoA dehydrogenase, partial [Pseudomonadales bacterium]|nr:acyl-CoA dehydrogenase [Pseudomonadales bacterium]